MSLKAWRPLRAAAGVSLGILMGASGFSAAQAAEVTPASVNGVKHFFDCLGVLIQDGPAHQQYCSPGSWVPSNSSLSSFSGGALVCHPYYTSLDRPLFGRYDVASLGNWDEVAPSNGPAPELVAVKGCPCGYWSEIAPLFDAFTVATLEPQVDWPTNPGPTLKHKLLTAC
jgi:hypothetical protein